MRKKVQFFMNNKFDLAEKRKCILVVNDNSLECKEICEKILKKQENTVVVGCTVPAYVGQLKASIDFALTIFSPQLVAARS